MRSTGCVEGTRVSSRVSSCPYPPEEQHRAETDQHERPDEAPVDERERAEVGEEPERADGDQHRGDHLLPSFTDSDGRRALADRDRDPQHDVEKDRRATGEREHDEGEADERRIDAEVLTEATADARDHLVGRAAVEPWRGLDVLHGMGWPPCYFDTPLGTATLRASITASRPARASRSGTARRRRPARPRSAASAATRS